MSRWQADRSGCALTGFMVLVMAVLLVGLALVLWPYVQEGIDLIQRNR